MIRLLDTQLLLWAAYAPDRLPAAARTMLEDDTTVAWFSAASVWEVGIKAGLGRADFSVDPRVFRRGLIDSGYRELAISSAHAAAVSDLPLLHRDPFDRMLVAQSHADGIPLVTSDRQVAQYGSPVLFVE